MRIIYIMLTAMSCHIALTAQRPRNGEEMTKEEGNVFMLQPKIHGTIRGKYEYQPGMESSRFEVRNARISLESDGQRTVTYKAEVDLSDEGDIKMLDAYVRLTPIEPLHFTLGQMRVPFSIDAHRSPHAQYFANRSFIAKQVGNVRDVGITATFKNHSIVPITIEAGLFNGNGLTEQKVAWHKDTNYSIKLQTTPFRNVNLTASIQHSRCSGDSVHYTSFDFGSYYDNGKWHAEVEYLRKDYSDGYFDGVNAVDAFVSYSLPLRKSVINSISFLTRYDYMSNHTDGTKGWDNQGKLKITDYERHRITPGMTLRMKEKQCVSELRLNYEKYFYKSHGIPKESEQDKLVAELMIRF